MYSIYHSLIFEAILFASLTRPWQKYHKKQKQKRNRSFPAGRSDAVLDAEEGTVL